LSSSFAIARTQPKQCTEALLANKSCFLSSSSWEPVFKSCIISTESFTDRSELGIDLLQIKAKISGIAKRTNHAVYNQTTLEPLYFETLATEIRLIRSSILSWRRKFNIALIHASSKVPQNSAADFGKRYELLAIALIINIVTSRLLLSISPSERTILEEEVQNLAIELKAVQSSLNHNRRAEFFFAQKARIAEAAITTHTTFWDVRDSGVVVELWRLEEFFNAIGRKCCDGETCCDTGE
jgi:hypothetical protein